MASEQSTLKKRAAKWSALRRFDKTLVAESATRFGRTLMGVAGADEVGRGSLIGPVVAGAMVIPESVSARQHRWIQGIDDSKAAHFTHPIRVELAEQLKSVCYWGLGEATQEEVERLNVVQASLLASYRALEHMAQQFESCLLDELLVVIDGKMTIPGLPYCQIPVVKADGRSAAVAGASILAKAHRDCWVIAMASEFPGYEWENNMGYGTPRHLEGIRKLGLTALHRRTYKLVKELGVETQRMLPLG